MADILLREDGPREGFQIHSEVIPTESKLELISALAETGIQSIEVTSFVRPDKVPQHADAEQVAEGLPDKPDVRFRALYLNEQGYLRALQCPKLSVEGYILIAASEEFLKANNNTTIDEALSRFDRWAELFKENNTPLERVMVSTAFGDHIAGELGSRPVLAVVDRIFEKAESVGMKIPEVTFADTTGFGTPGTVRRLIAGFKRRYPDVELGLHLHDTRGTGMANVYAGLLEGVTRFDCSVAGLGGCPFTQGGAGNVPTEDVAFMCEEAGYSTGLDLKKYIECAKLAEKITGKHLPGKLKDSGVL